MSMSGREQVLAGSPAAPRWRPTQWARVPVALAGLAAVGIAVNIAATAFDLGDRGATNNLADASYQALMAGAAIATLLRAALVPVNRGAWLATGIGLVAWALGELGLVGVPDSVFIEHEWASHVAFLLFYVGVLTGLRLLAGHAGADPLLTYGFLVGLLGLMTLWAGVFFGPAEGESFAVAADFAYPLLDLAVLGIIGGIWAMHGWRRDPALGVLAVAFVVIAVADAVYAVRVHENTVPEYWTIYDSLWPIGAVLIGAAAWLDRDRARPIEFTTEWLSLSIAITAGLLAIVVLVWDHYERAADAAVIIAAGTLVAVLVHAVLLQDRWSHARWHGSRAATLSGQALATVAAMRSGHGSDSLERRAELAGALGGELGLDEDRIEALRGTARLATVGGLAEAPASQEGPAGPYMSDAARAADLLEAIGLAGQAGQVRHSDERWDERTKNGSKPGRLSLESSVLAVIDAMETLVSRPPEGQGLALDVAVARVVAQRGTRFDPRVVDALEQAYRSDA
jgi:hypothetical protein